MATNFLTILLMVLTASLTAQASGCHLSNVPPTKSTARQILTSVQEMLQNQKTCEAAQGLVQVFNQYPLDFAESNGLFLLIHLEIELGQFDDAMEVYKTWPWDVGHNQRFSPWKFIPDGQEAGTRLMIWQLFARYIPKDAGLCIENPLSGACDEGAGLDNEDENFAKEFPNSPYLPEMQKITTQFYRYKIEHEQGLLRENIAQYESSVHPQAGFHSWIVNLRNKSNSDPSKVFANCVGPTEKVEGKCDLVKKSTLLGNIILQALRTEFYARPEDKRPLAPIISKYVKEMQQMLSSDPSIFKDLIPPLREMNFADVLQAHQ